MASAEQLKALLKSHINGDDSHFYSVAMQVAAHEAKLGHGKLALELKALIDAAKARSPGKADAKATPISQRTAEPRENSSTWFNTATQAALGWATWYR